MFFTALIELFSLATVFPFLTFLIDPQLLWKDPIINIANQLGIDKPAEFILPMTVAFSLSALFAGAIRLGNLWINGRMAAAIGSDLSTKAFRNTLHQPYIDHIKTNSSEIIADLTKHIDITISALNALLQLLTSFFVAAGLLIGLLIVNYKVSLGSFTLFASIYIILALYSQARLRENGLKSANSISKQLKVIQESVGAFREVVLTNTQSVFIEEYNNADIEIRKLSAQTQFIGLSPRYILEAVAMVVIAVLGFYTVQYSGQSTSALPFLGLFALGAQRLLPALQQIFNSWSQIKSYNESIHRVLQNLRKPLYTSSLDSSPLDCFDSLEFKSVSFAYNCTHNILTNVDISIRKGETVGIVGTTGSGKSTFIDLLMGLLTPTSGTILVDDVEIGNPNSSIELQSWQKCISHVPQSIYLTAGTVAENIAFGITKNKIDMDRVVKCARIAKIDEFVESLPLAYQNIVGERGVFLSGGQKQRLGIARALYRKSQVLILDEATSALDIATEKLVMDSIYSLNANLTIFMIAHRISTLDKCDRIIHLCDGKISLT